MALCVNTVSLIESCKNCNKTIDLENELFYTIGKEPSRKEKIIEKKRQRIFFFHKECFEEIAGKDYL